MGRKSRRKYNQDPEDVAKADKKEITSLCSQILEIAGRPSPMTPAKQWEEYLQIHSLVEKIRKKQHDVSFDNHNREEHVEEFMAWAHSQDIICDSVSIHQIDEQGLGLKAVKEIKEHDPFLTVPRKAMLTEDRVLDSPLGPLIRKDRVLQGMAHVALALFLLMERQSEHSNWKPYINILPSSYQVPLYFTPDELQQLQGSPTYTDALKQHKNIARQFAYFYKLFQMHVDAVKLPLKECFTYDGYRWAVSTVMSRQNQIPSEDGSHLVTVLIPLWDMCNHTNGVITTSFNLQRDSCDGLALHDVAVGEQVCIFYGLRSNSHLLLYSGFVYPESECDSVNIQLGISKNDRLYAMKSQLLAMMGSAESSINLAVEGGDNPVSPELIAFLRVFSMDEEELVIRMFDKNKTESLGRLIRPNCLISKANELRVWSFLETRLSLLLRQYKTTIEEDIEQLSKTDLSSNSKLCIQLRLLEKRILHNAIAYIKIRRKDTEELADDAVCYQEELESEDMDKVVEVPDASPAQVARLEYKTNPIDTQSDGSSSSNRNSSLSLQSDTSEDSISKPVNQITTEPSDSMGSAVTNGDNESYNSEIKVNGTVDSLNNALNGINLNGDSSHPVDGDTEGNHAATVSNGHSELNSIADNN
ncbi:actin-histidine N-methyltransferase-like [Patiria miniata]|uniref:protein-histidine N-methyltransferase n=1 Tax=Patiria miniata TaxID=46514 RepID=A0A914BHW2_PATMI|nr:actin-histidine N-methyltransferase-like [Patiria miniata]